ncbi:MAG: hypothetical protein ABFC34_13765, partial [Methanobacterium sp.]
VINYILGIHCTLDTTNFDKNLDSTIIDCQKLADRVDELVLGDVNVQADWSQADSGLDDFIKNKPVIPTANTNWLDTTNFDNNLAKTVTTVQILADRVDDFLLQSDWNQTDNQIEDYIKNKPTIPAAQIQSDWNQTDNGIVDFIKNKPTIPSGDSMDLGAILTTTATFKGITIDAEIDSFACSAGDLMQMQPSGLYIGANAVSVDRCYMLGIATEAGNASTISLLTYGQFCLTSWNWTVGAPLYVSLNSGIMTQTPPASTTDETNICVGFAISADTIFFNPYIAWATHV